MKADIQEAIVAAGSLACNSVVILTPHIQLCSFRLQKAGTLISAIEAGEYPSIAFAASAAASAQLPIYRLARARKP